MTIGAVDLIARLFLDELVLVAIVVIDLVVLTMQYQLSQRAIRSIALRLGHGADMWHVAVC